MIINELNIFVRNIISTICKTRDFEAAIYNGSLYIILDNTVMYMIDISDKIPYNMISEFQIGFNPASMSVNPDYIMPSDCIYRVIPKVQQYISFLSTSPKVYECIDQRSDEVFETMLSLKASDGAGFYFVDADTYKPFVPIFNRLLSINKQDKVGMELYDYGNNIYIVVFNIYKQKIKMNTKLMMKILNVNRPLYYTRGNQV